MSKSLLEKFNEKDLFDRFTIVRFRDGDTLEGFRKCGHCGCCREEAIRLIGIESWETASEEKARAIAVARTLTRTYRGTVGYISSTASRRDKYGRLCAEVYIDGEPITTALVNGGFAWYGVREPMPNGHPLPDLTT